MNEAQAGQPETRRVALLRGINVGGGNRIAMADLRACTEAAADEVHVCGGGAANGALMRVSPLGVFGAREDVGIVAAADFARADAGLTHPNPVCVDANAVFVTGLVTGIRGGTAREVVDAMESATSEQAVAQAIAAGRTGDVSAYEGHMGWVLLALSIAVTGACVWIPERPGAKRPSAASSCCEAARIAAGPDAVPPP